MEWKVPLWKMKISEEQYEEVKLKLRNAFLSHNYQQKQAIIKDASLFYAEWWRREYTGGRTSKEAIANALNIPSTCSEELFELAKKGGKSLRIPVIVRQNKLWFRTLLIQGGLPMHHIHSNRDHIIVYKNFLTSLIKHTKSVYVDWSDSSFIENLPCSKYLPLSFQNEGIYDVSLLIARAIIEEKDELLPYDASEGEWHILTNDLKESSRTEYSRAVPFILNWKILKTQDLIQLSYTVEIANKISEAYIKENKLSECYSFSLYVQGKHIATYIRAINDEFKCREKRIINFFWNEEPVISLQIKTDSNQIIDITAPNSFAPDLEEPQLLVESDGCWRFTSGTSNSNKNAVIFPQDWSIEENAQELQVYSRNLFWCEFCGTISLKNIESGEEIIFDQTETTYTFEFSGWSIDWVQNANYKILACEPDIRLYNASNERIRTGKVFYREYRRHEWKKYQHGILPIGFLEFKVELPDNHFFKEKFYYTGPLNCLFKNLSQDHGEISLEWEGGTIMPAKDQPGIDISELYHNTWRIHRQKDMVYYPDTTNFQLCPSPNVTNSPILVLSVASPFKGVVLLDQNGHEIPNGTILCRTSLFGYRYIVMGQNVPTEVFHLENEKTVVSGMLPIGIHSLSSFEDDIREVFLHNGSDPFDSESKVRIVIGRGGNIKMIEVKEYNVFSMQKIPDGPIVIVNNREDQEMLDFQGILYALAVDCPCEEIRVEELLKKEDGFHLKEGSDLSRFIVFTDKLVSNDKGEQVVPRFFNNSKEDKIVLDPLNGILTPQEANINSLKTSLEQASAFSEDWNKVITHFGIAQKYSLPFKTLNCFRAISQSPLLMVKMALRLCQSANITRDDFLAGLSRYEGEFAVAWHWIESEYWDQGSEWFCEKIPENLVSALFINLFESRKLLLSYTLNAYEEIFLTVLLKVPNDTSPVLPPSRVKINSIREKLGGNTNFPNILILIPNEWRVLFPLSMDRELPIYIRALLISPVKAALAITGKDDSIWDEENLKMRRTINFYRQFLPVEYLEIFTCMIRRIYQTR